MRILFLLISSLASISFQYSISEKFNLPQRYRQYTESVWIEFEKIEEQFKPLNLGPGSPDYPPPSFITKALSYVANGDHHLNQYTRGYGHPRLVNVLSQLYSKWIGRYVDPNDEILITVGAYQSLYSAIFGHIDEGDEVILIEPFYDCYLDIITSAGGIPKSVALKPTKSGVISSADWKLDPHEFEKLFNNKTKMLILNTPNNPIGKAFDLEELKMIANLCKKWNVLVVSDEVYEHMVFEPKKHIRICTLPGMWERTLTIGSAGKTFSVTGWKLGWTYGPKNLMKNLQIVHQNSVHICATPLQEALAIAFEYEMTKLGSNYSFFEVIKHELQEKRDFMVKVLIEAGFSPTIPDAGYLMVADWHKLADRIDLTLETDEFKDYRFTKWMAKNISLQALPTSAFYTKPNKHFGENFVRFCYIKSDETLQRAKDILKNWHKE